ncbi:MAG: TRAP transporter small permease [Rhodospirillaceae bacterium]|nr:TRAP transporter small permease [Rhodospirillaceae bacterium]
MIEQFEAVFCRLNAFIAGLVAVSIAGFAVLIPLDLVIRKLGWGNMPWLYEGIEYVLYLGVFLGATWVLQHNAHVRVDVVTASLPERTARALEFAVDIFGAMLCAFLCYYGVMATIRDYVDKSLPDKDLVLPNWYLMLAFAVAFFFLTIEFLLRARRAILDRVEEHTETGF